MREIVEDIYDDEFYNILYFYEIFYYKVVLFLDLLIMYECNQLVVELVLQLLEVVNLLKHFFFFFFMVLVPLELFLLLFGVIYLENMILVFQKVMSVLDYLLKHLLYHYLKNLNYLLG